MARNLNIWHNNWLATGVKVLVPRYVTDVTLQWTDDAGSQHERSESLRFPDMLQNIDLSDLKEFMIEMALKEACKRLGIDQELSA